MAERKCRDPLFRQSLRSSLHWLPDGRLVYALGMKLTTMGKPVDGDVPAIWKIASPPNASPEEWLDFAN